MDYTKIGLGELLSIDDETIKRNAISILKQLQRINYTEQVEKNSESNND